MQGIFCELDEDIAVRLRFSFTRILLLLMLRE